MRRIEELSNVRYRDGNWKRKVVEYWLWCDEGTEEICKVLKITRPLLNHWHRWHICTRELCYKSPPLTLSPQLIAWQKKQRMKNKKLEKQLASDAQNVEVLQKQIAALQASLKHEQLRAEAMSTMIDIAEKEFKIEIRKKSGAKQLKP
jgi:hypothetical protein